VDRAGLIPKRVQVVNLLMQKLPWKRTWHGFKSRPEPQTSGSVLCLVFLFQGWPFELSLGPVSRCARAKSLFDPLKKDDLQSAIVNFCREYLWGMKIQGIDLSKSPGIVDLIIWYHCADPPDGFSICSVKPKCLEKEDICPLSRGCLFFTMKTERNASK